MSNKEQYRKGSFPAGKAKKMGRFKNWTLCIIAFFVIMLFFMVSVRAAYSAGNTSQTADITVGVSPTNTVDYVLNPGEDFNVDVKAVNVTSLHSFHSL